MEPAKQSVSPSNPQIAEEYIVKIPRDKQKRFNVMRFNHSLNVDVTKWKQVKMERENNYKEFKLDNDDSPKYGAGSEFGRDLRDEARRKKHGIITKKYNPDGQPWILKMGGKGGRKFKGLRDGGVSENASYYVFTQSVDGTFEAYPVAEWYNFTQIQCYKALSPEEAEEAYGRREKVLNYFSIMTQKRMRGEIVEDDDDEKKPGNKSKKKKEHKEFKITDFDEFGNNKDSEEDSEDEEQLNDESKPSKKKKKVPKKTKKKKDQSDQSNDEALEESDEGDFDDKEVDYMTNSSSSEEEVGEEEKTNRDLKGVEDEEALRKLMSEDEDEENPEENKETEENAENKEKAVEAKPKKKPKKSDSSGESTSESSDSDFDDPKFTSAIFVPNFQKSKKKTGSDNSAGSSRANTPTRPHGDKDGQRNPKRKFNNEASSSIAKKQKTDSQSGRSFNTLDGINEETVRRYLQRKPMTAVELLHKFKSKKTKMSSQQLVQKIADVLKRMDLLKSNIKGKMYLSVKNT